MPHICLTIDTLQNFPNKFVYYQYDSPYPALPTCAVCSQFPPSAPLFPSLHSSPLNPQRKPLHPTHTHTCTQSEAEITAGSGSGNAATCHSAVLAMRAMLQRLQRVEDEISQVNNHHLLSGLIIVV